MGTDYNKCKNITLLKESLKSSEVTLQVDFAENYVCHYAEEISSAYYSKKQVTNHPAVIHYNTDPESEQGNQSIKHKSVVCLSDEIAHTAPTEFAFMKRLTCCIKEFLGNIEQIHYISNSPTSQYRNCHIFKILSLHKEMFGIGATWQYFESGHGKGPCDSVGGVVKRNADLAVRKGQLIQTAKDFYNFGIESNTNVSYILVDKTEKEAAANMLKVLGTLSVPGTMKIHRALAAETCLYVRETSCFKKCCWSNGRFHSVKAG